MSEALLNQDFKDKMSKYSQIAKSPNVSFVPLIFLDTGKAHHVAAKFIKWLCFVAIPGSRCQKNKSVAIGNAWIGRFSFLLQLLLLLLLYFIFHLKIFLSFSFSFSFRS